MQSQFDLCFTDADSGHAKIFLPPIIPKFYYSLWLIQIWKNVSKFHYTVWLDQFRKRSKSGIVRQKKFSSSKVHNTVFLWIVQISYREHRLQMFRKNLWNLWLASLNYFYNLGHIFQYFHRLKRVLSLRKMSNYYSLLLKVSIAPVIFISIEDKQFQKILWCVVHKYVENLYK